jgi:alkylation response protein AidB-like acyl-CoA dehydrogenase
MRSPDARVRAQNPYIEVLMSVDLDSDQIILRDSVRKYLAKEVEPRILDCERDHAIPLDIFRGLIPFGYQGGQLPEADGGLDVDFITWAMMMEELGYAWGSLRTSISTTNAYLRIVSKYGTVAQKQQFLEPAMKGEKHVANAFSEPHGASDPSAILTKAELKDGHYLLNGEKIWITNGHASKLLVVLARTFSPTCDGKPSLFLLDREESPYETRIIDKMVVKASGTSAVSLVDVKVPKANLLGEEGEALKSALTSINHAKLNMAMGSTGLAQRALDMAIDYAKTRVVFGKPIGANQLIQKHIVDMSVRTHACRALGYQSAVALQKGLPARMECSMAKLYASVAAHEVAEMALAVYGGMGYACDFPIERIYRDTAGATIPDGTPEIQTLIVGREILGISAIR